MRAGWATGRAVRCGARFRFGRRTGASGAGSRSHRFRRTAPGCARTLTAPTGTASAGPRSIARQHHPRAVLEPVSALGDDTLANLQAGGNHDFVDRRLAALHRPQTDRALGRIKDVHIVAAAAQAQGRDRHHHGVGNRADQQPHIDELTRKKRQLTIGKAGLGLDRAGGGVHLVVQRGEHAGIQHEGTGAVQRGDFHRCTARGTFLQLANLVLRNRKHHINRRHLGDQCNPVGVGAAHYIAHIDGTQPDPSADRSRDARIAEIEASRTLVGLVNHNGAL